MVLLLQLTQFVLLHQTVAKISATMMSAEDSNQLKDSIPQQIKEKIIEIRDALLKCVEVSKVYLYGSYAKGTFTNDSDIDIAVFVVSEANERENYIEFNRLARCSKYDIQIQVFNEEELNEPNGIIDEIVRYGTDITSIEV